MTNTNSRSIARIARTAAALLALAGFTGCGAEGTSGDLAFAGDTHFVSHPELASALHGEETVLEGTAALRSHPELTDALRSPSFEIEPTTIVTAPDARLSAALGVEFVHAPVVAPIGASALASVIPPSASALLDESTACETDADCVPDGCHATECVARGFEAPTLQCTADFRYGTLDGGHCLCDAGQCAAQLSRFGI